MLSKVAEISPPETPPTYIPVSRVKPLIADIPKVNGIANATPIAAVKPGIEPKTIPPKTPNRSNKKVRGWKVLVSPSVKTLIKALSKI